MDVFKLNINFYERN